MGKSRRGKAIVLSREPSEVKGFKPNTVDDKDLKKSINYFEWSLDIVETSGRWGLTADVLKEQWCSPTKGLLKTLLDYENLTWRELANQTSGRNRGTRNHHVKVSEILKEAQRLLRNSFVDDLEEIYSLRITGKVRFYGIIQDSVFHILWYDPKHEIYPTKRR